MLLIQKQLLIITQLFTGRASIRARKLEIKTLIRKVYQHKGV